MGAKETIRETLNALLKESGAKRYELADHIGVSRAAVSNWVKGNNSIDVDFIPGICDFFGISVDEFFGMKKPRAMTREEAKLLSLFGGFNADGRRRLLEDAEIMARSGMYQKTEDNKVSRTA